MSFLENFLSFPPTVLGVLDHRPLQILNLSLPYSLDTVLDLFWNSVLRVYFLFYVDSSHLYILSPHFFFFFLLSCCWYSGILELNQLKLGHFYLIPGSQTVPRNDLARHKSMELNAGVISVCSISLRSHFSIYFLGNWRSQANISSWTVLQLHYMQWNIAFSHADL